MGITPDDLLDLISLDLNIKVTSSGNQKLQIPYPISLKQMPYFYAMIFLLKNSV